jgi:hypothetical protein
MNITTIVEEIGVAIKQYNPYFDTYYTNVEKSERLGIVHNGNEAVFPNDYSGNFFYVRIPSQLRVFYDNQNNNADRSIGIRADLVIVAQVQSADAYQLALNLISTIGRACKYSKTISSILIHPEDVISQELNGVSDDVLKAALERIPNTTMVAINISVSYFQTFLQLDCIQNPCKICS